MRVKSFTAYKGTLAHRGEKNNEYSATKDLQKNSCLAGRFHVLFQKNTFQKFYGTFFNGPLALGLL